jgi:TolB protein
VQGQDGRLIKPSIDQAPDCDKQAALIISSPTPIEMAGESYKYLIISADKDHI